MFGSVPAFDRFSRRGFRTSGFWPKALREVHAYLEQNYAAIESRRVQTMSFDGSTTDRVYTQAKVIDMIFFVHGGGQGH